MNVPPQEAIRVPADQLRALASAILLNVGLPQADGDLIARLLVDTDLRGVLSHGTYHVNEYVHFYLSGQLNRVPHVRVTRDEPVTAIVDGDRGLGHLAASRATELAIAKAKALGVGAVVSRHHGHYGSAGKYTRMAIRQDCIGFCVSGHAIERRIVDHPHWNTMGNPPMSFAFPAHAEAPPILDMGTALFRADDFLPLFEQVPAAFFKSIGLIATSLLLGGVLTGMGSPGFCDEHDKYPAASYGAFICVWDVGRFMPTEVFKAEADRSIRDLHELPPLPGYERYDLPGGSEWDREHAWAVEGIPLGREHQRLLEEAAALVDVPVPWR